jgi:hypothetical protein
MTTVRRTAEIIRIHVIHETLDSVAVEIHGATLLTRADTAGILVGMRVIPGTRVNRESHVIQVIGDRMLVITVPREVRVEMTEARHVTIVVRVAMIVVLAETIVARVEMTVVRVVMTEVRVEMIDEVTRVDPVRVRDVAARVILAGTTEVRE